MAELTTNINFLQSTQFKVIIDRKKFGNLEFFAQSFQHPGVTVTSAPMAYKRISTVGLPGDTLTIDELGFEVIVDENMNSYIEMYNWAKSQTEDRRGIQLGQGSRAGNDRAATADPCAHDREPDQHLECSDLPSGVPVLPRATTESNGCPEREARREKTNRLRP